MKSILQDWVMNLGLRHQGVLLSAVRGCDTVSRDEASKWLARFYRACILNAHCGDIAKSKSFMVWLTPVDFWGHANRVLNFHDHLPHHYIMHVVHSSEILGYYYPEAEVQGIWRDFYYLLSAKLHLNPETQMQLDSRLNASEVVFEREQDLRGHPVCE